MSIKPDSMTVHLFFKSFSQDQVVQILLRFGQLSICNLDFNDKHLYYSNTLTYSFPE